MFKFEVEEQKTSSRVELNQYTSEKKLEDTTQQIQELVDAYTKELNDLVSKNNKFITVIAHDIKNSFNSILGFLTLLKKNYNSYDKEVITEYIDTIYNSANNTYQLLNSLLEWALSQNSKLHFKPVSANLLDILKFELSSISFLAKQKHIEFQYNIPLDLHVNADIQMLRTIIRNLCSNAIKFTNPSGSIFLIAEPGEEVALIKVIDTGIGIDPNDKDRLFKIENYFSNIGTGGEIGTGLGLLLCKEFVEMHGGKILVESIAGKGSEFAFTIPLVEDTELQFNS